MWPFMKKKKADFSDYVSFPRFLEASQLELTENESTAANIGLEVLNGSPIHPQATTLYRAILGGSLVAYAIFLIRSIKRLGLKVNDIIQTFDKAYTIYPNNGILAEKMRFYEAIKEPNEQQKVQVLLDSKRVSMNEYEELFTLTITNVLTRLEKLDIEDV